MTPHWNELGLREPDEVKGGRLARVWWWWVETSPGRLCGRSLSVFGDGFRVATRRGEKGHFTIESAAAHLRRLGCQKEGAQ